MGISAPEQRNLPDPRPMSEAYGERLREVWLVRQGRREQGGPTGNGRKQEITKRDNYQTAYPVPRPEQLHRNHHAGFLSSGPGETRREQQEVARFGRQSSARCGSSQSRDSRNVAFAKLTIMAHPAESGLATSECKTTAVRPTFPCTLAQLSDTCASARSLLAVAAMLAVGASKHASSLPMMRDCRGVCSS